MAKKKHQKLTLKEMRFVDAFLGSCAGNGTEAVLMAGYGQSRKAAAVTATRLLRKANIQAEIQGREAARAKEAIATADERDEILTNIARGEVPAIVKISAVKELNKCTGRHSIKHLHEGKLTLEQAIAESRK